MASDIFERPLTKIVGDRTAKVLAAQLDLKTLGDLLRHYPRRYVVRGRSEEHTSELRHT